jgi:hypothetical protein
VCHIRLPGARRPRRHGDASFVPSKSPRARASVDALVSSRGIKKPAEAGGFLSRSPARPFGTAIPFAFRWPASFVYAAFQLFGKRQTIRSVDRQRGPPPPHPLVASPTPPRQRRERHLLKLARFLLARTLILMDLSRTRGSAWHRRAHPLQKSRSFLATF